MREWNGQKYPPGVALPITARLFDAQHGRCFHCYVQMDSGPYRRERRPLGWTREHVVPVALGGKLFRNIVLAHRPCNHLRGVRRLTPGEMLRVRLLHEQAYLNERS